MIPQRNHAKTLSLFILLMALMLAIFSHASAAPPVPADGSTVIAGDVTGSSIDLMGETLTLPTGYTVAAYSKNGGKAWTAGALSPTVFPTLIDGGLDLRLSNKYDTAKKTVPADAQIIAFPAIAKRPNLAATAASINYLLLASPNGTSLGNWTLSPRATKTLPNPPSNAQNYLIADMLPTDRNKPNNATWRSFPPAGIPVAPADTVASARQNYFVRTYPSVKGGVITPQSKSLRLSPASAQKPLQIRANYKTEMLTPKAGAIIYGGTLANLRAHASPNAAMVTTKDAFGLGKAYVYKNADKGVSIAGLLNDADPTICLWLPATITKPASEMCEYKLAPRAEAISQSLEIKNGRIVFPNTMEFRNPLTWKWGGLPAIGASTEVVASVRLKATAKATGVDDREGVSAGLLSDLIVKVGTLDNGKPGIISATLRPTSTTRQRSIDFNRVDITIQ